MGVPQIIQSLDNVNIESHDDSGNTILRKPRVYSQYFSIFIVGNSWEYQ